MSVSIIFQNDYEAFQKMKSILRNLRWLVENFHYTNFCIEYKYFLLYEIMNALLFVIYASFLQQVSQKLYKNLCENGVLNVVAQNRGHGDATFLKLPLMSSGITDADVVYIVKVIDFYGQNL